MDIGRRIANGVQGANDTGGGATGARPDAQHRFTTLFDTGHRHFDHQAVNIKRRNRIHRFVVIGGIADRSWLTTQGQEIKDLQVNPEGVIGLTGIDFHRALRCIESVDRGIGQALVVGGGLLANVDRGSRLIADNDGGSAGFGLFGHSVELLAVPVRVIERSDGPDIVEEGGRRFHLHFAGQRIGNVGPGVAVVIDIEVIERRVVPLVVIGAAFRSFKRNPGADQDDIVLILRGEKDIGVGVVRIRIFGDQGRFTMARSAGLGLAGDQNHCDKQQRRQDGTTKQR